LLVAELSICAHAMLAAVLDRGRMPSRTLQEAIPPRNLVAWFGELEALVNAGLLHRIDGPDGAMYQATRAGHFQIAAWIAAPSWRRNVA
jgi:hypothetical protein